MDDELNSISMSNLPPFEEEDLAFSLNNAFNSSSFLMFMEKMIKIWPMMSFFVMRIGFLM